MPLVETRARHSLERKLLLWTIGLVIAPTFACVIWLDDMTQTAMSEHHARNVATLGQTVAVALGNREGQDLASAAQGHLRVLAVDQRFAFVAVADAQDRLIYRRAMDAGAWLEYQQWADAQGLMPKIEVGQPVVLGKTGELVVQRVPVWNPPLNHGALHRGINEASNRKLEGHVLVALREHTLPETLYQLRAMQLTAACVICLLCLPIVIWAVRRVTGPLRALCEASLRLASGGVPEPIEARRRDEVGMLAEAFNYMAGKLVTARNLLQNANEELERKVAERTAELQRLNQQLELAARQFETMAATDPLTGLANRRAFGEAMCRCFSEARRYGDDLACIMVDLDGFKQLNDTLGHQKGDELLQVMAHSLRDSCRGSDVAGRFGGDEFVLLLPRATEEMARRVVDRIRNYFTLEVEKLLVGTPLEGKVTMSLGLATLHETGARDPDDLLTKADHALYRAKEGGKDRLVTYHRPRKSGAGTAEPQAAPAPAPAPQ